MPIVFVSPEGTNEKIGQLVELVDEFDFIYHANTDDCAAITECFMDYIPSKVIASADLQLPNAREKLFRIMNRITIDSGNILIVAHRDFFNELSPQFMKEDWESINICQKYTI